MPFIEWKPFHFESKSTVFALHFSYFYFQLRNFLDKGLCNCNVMSTISTKNGFVFHFFCTKRTLHFRSCSVTFTTNSRCPPRPSPSLISTLILCEPGGSSALGMSSPLGPQNSLTLSVRSTDGSFLYVTINEFVSIFAPRGSNLSLR